MTYEAFFQGLSEYRYSKGVLERRDGDIRSPTPLVEGDPSLVIVRYALRWQPRSRVCTPPSTNGVGDLISPPRRSKTPLEYLYSDRP